MKIDHINHNGLDNRFENLHEPTRGQNKQNSRSKLKSTSKFKGIYRCKNERWHSQIMINKTSAHLGYYENERDAALVCDRAAILAFGEFAHTNFPPAESEHVVLPARVLSKLGRRN